MFDWECSADIIEMFKDKRWNDSSFKRRTNIKKDTENIEKEELNKKWIEDWTKQVELEKELEKEG